MRKGQSRADSRTKRDKQGALDRGGDRPKAGGNLPGEEKVKMNCDSPVRERNPSAPEEERPRPKHLGDMIQEKEKEKEKVIVDANGRG